jgi:Starch-binding associating with outer membrane/Susd and RagB outer membrane lipoprotein
MKNNKLFIGILTCLSLFSFISCETLDQDKSVDPFNLNESNANVEFLFNSIEEDFVRQIEGDADYSTDDNFTSGGAQNGDGLSLFGAQLTRVYSLSNGNAKNYASTFLASDSDDEWVNAYDGILKDSRLMTKLALEQGRTKHIGIAQFIEAYTMSAMVDFYGDIPYSEALLGSQNLSPKLDSGASIYAKCIILLDKAIVNFGTTAPNPKIEVFYNNDYKKWKKAANTLKMKLYLQTRLVDNTAITKFNAIVATGDYIMSSDDDLVYKWAATSTSNPDSRHPRFGLNYTSTGAGDYMSNWLMNTMNTTSDPRIRYYFYRQSVTVPGQGEPASEENLACSLQTAPAHYAGYTFCNLPDGYWGRDHGDSAGTPPDGFLRTTFGVYPAGGKFDGDNFEGVETISGGKGKGITPILLASWVDFMKAEVALSENNTGLAKTEMLNGLDKSINKVIDFGPTDPSIDITYVPTPVKINAYKTAISNKWDIATDTGKWDIFATQQFIATFGNGIESYNFYRRTGYPITLQPNRSPTPGGFVRSLYYPSNEVSANPNVKQKPSQTVAVFWNTNSSPIAN